MDEIKQLVARTFVELGATRTFSTCGKPCSWKTAAAWPWPIGPMHECRLLLHGRAYRVPQRQGKRGANVEPARTHGLHRRRHSRSSRWRRLAVA